VRFSLSLFAVFLLPGLAQAAECRAGAAQALATLRTPKASPEDRSEQGICLVRNYLGLPEVAGAALSIIKDPGEDLFLRQDLIEAFADARLRRLVKVKESLVPELKEHDRENLARTAGTAGDLLAMAQAVKSMDETVPVCASESQFVRAIADIAGADESPVVLRASAVASLEKVLERMVESGVYDDRAVRFAQESLRNVAARDDAGSHFSGAARSYAHLANASIPYFKVRSEGRALASVPSEDPR